MKNLHKNVGIFAASLLATITAAYIYSPAIGSHADSSATAEINLTVGEVMNLTLDTNSLDLSTTPNNFVSGVINATASTNSQHGYTLTLEDVDANTNLVHANENIEAAVSSNFEGKKTSTTMADNTWGFSLDATNFSKIPTNGSAVVIKTTNIPMTTASETTPVTFGAKVGNLTSGTYTDSVLFTIYTNGQDEPDEEIMQEFSCLDLENVGDSTVLADARDGNKYTVKKLADGNCWMTENLRLINKTITSEDSNLPEGEEWTIPASSTTGFKPYNTNDAYSDDTYGGFYTFYTATAGWGTTDITSGISPKDICPKGWRLPTGDDTGEYRVLYDNYQSFDEMRGEPNFDLFGYLWNGSAVNQNRAGYYWSSTVKDSSRAWHMFLSNSPVLVNQAAPTDKYYGFSIRCIARN